MINTTDLPRALGEDISNCHCSGPDCQVTKNRQSREIDMGCFRCSSQISNEFCARCLVFAEDEENTSKASSLIPDY